MVLYHNLKMNKNPRKKLSVLFFVVASTIAITGRADIFKTIDQHGNVTYSDKPSNQAEQINLPPTPLIHVTTPNPKSTPPTEANENQQLGASSYQQLDINEPSDNKSIHNNTGDVAVSVSLQPSLSSGHTISISVDGKEFYKGTASSTTLNNIDRGTHALQAAILDHKGQVLIKSKTRTFHLHRQSALFHPNPN